MTLQEFISFWQAQPFRAFRMRTTRGEFVVSYPMGLALNAQMQVMIVVDDTRVEMFAMDEIEACEGFGPPMNTAEAMGAISPETLARNAQLLSAAMTAVEPEPLQQAADNFDCGTFTIHSTHTAEGIHIAQVDVQTRDGQSMLSTAGTRWNLHGLEQFKNGTSLYLHHLEHPTVEQRIIFWPPDKGTFDSFAEALSCNALAKELHRRDVQLAVKPAKPAVPPASYFRKIVVPWEILERDGKAAAFGEEDPAMDPDRYEFVLVPRKLEDGREIHNPCLTDFMKEEIILNLVDTNWDASGHRDDRIWHIVLRHPFNVGKQTTLHIDVDIRAVTIDEDPTLLPLGWVERHLRNFDLYEPWDVMTAALRLGPVKPKHPDLVVGMAGGFRAELWAGEPRFTTPFLQPHIIDAEGRAIFDLRATTWSAAVHPDHERPAVTLIFSSGEHGAREVASSYPLELDLVTQRVTCNKLEGYTAIGMIQAMVRRVRGVKWMLEDIPKWFAKGRF